MLTTIAVQNYRSLHDLRVPLGPLTVVTGPNGSGKSNLYRALRLLAECAERRVIPSLAREGGLPSVLWAGPAVLAGSVRRGEHPVEGTTRRGPVSLQLGFAADDFSYLIDLGVPTAQKSAFDLDPEIKRELIWVGPVLRPAAVLVRRTRRLVEVRGAGPLEPLTDRLATFESVLTEVNDPRSAPELLAVRDLIRSWRFYDQFRTDSGAPARQLGIGTRTPVLAADGGDLAAAVQTIVEVGDAAGLETAVADAFDGACLGVGVRDGRFALQLQGRGLLRPLGPQELSDGTLRYLLLVAALLSPRPPGLLVLNEPETSLHPDLYGPLARLIESAAARSQVLVVSHAASLVEALTGSVGATAVELELDLGETRVAGQGPLDGPVWTWGTR